MAVFGHNGRKGVELNHAIIIFLINYLSEDFVKKYFSLKKTPISHDIAHESKFQLEPNFV